MSILTRNPNFKKLLSKYNDTSCCYGYKIRRTFVTPYITESYLKGRLEYDRYKYDDVVYPEIENVPLKFAISARNKWTVSQCDIVVVYINHTSGGAYEAAKHAKRKNKRIINLGKTEL